MKIINIVEKSIEIILKNQHITGSYIACPNFDTYKYCWLRDGSFTAYAVDLYGYYDSAEKYFDWVDRVIKIQRDKVDEIVKMTEKNEPLLNFDYLPTRYNLNGEAEDDEWPNFQIDGYGTWLWALAQHILLTGNRELIFRYSDSIKITIDYLLLLWRYPNYDCWEENGDKVHTSTLSCVYGGLKSISEFIEDERINNTLDEIKKFITSKCLLDGRLVKYEGSKCVDASLIWTSVPFGIFNPKDTIIENTIREIENKLVHNFGTHRYAEDTYYGGGEWILLTGYLGWYYCKAGDLKRARMCLDWMESHADENGELVEQVLDHVNDKEYIDKWKNLWGEVAKPLLWSHAMYLILNKNIEEV
ncbi:Glycosyl hydrolases family 15 [Caloramator quimbayensis]|uniref:Glycosyl hydrolases family 15 n=1 Tax=Caloramator quimbayensis TaxID=1147123 RepID=A0A1T4XVK3_9CLOT|nr:glycoside hydrolase family 15 protein [Caloramator quimbayensis]SKA93081.1 Glycosyl hydrolases family 15 [Caloramator quimbayensis]